MSTQHSIRGSHRAGRARWAVLLLGALALTACEQADPVLPGAREALREPVSVAEEPGSAPTRLPAITRNADWAQAAVSPGNRVAHAALAEAPALAWSVPIGAGDSRRQRIVVDPVVSGGRVFAMDAEHTVSAVSTDGAVLWQVPLVPARDDAAQAQGGGLAVAGGTVYAASGFGTVTALEAETGAVRWVQDLDGTATGAPTIVDGLLYITVADRSGVAIETDTGRVRWRIDAGGDVGNVAGAPAPAVAGDRVVFGFGDGSVEGAFRRGGLRLWRADIAGRRIGLARAGIDDITGDPVIAGDTVYAGSHSGRLVALSVFTGARDWTLSEGALGPVWPAGGSVFLVSDQTQLMRVNASDGAVIWRVDLPGYEPRRNPNRQRDSAFVHHGPVLAGGRLWLAGSDGVLRAFAPEDGALAAEVAIPGGATTRPAVAGGTLYLVSRDGSLLAYR